VDATADQAARTVTVTATDATSGVDAIEYSLGVAGEVSAFAEAEPPG
jgi:hypothetical protein